MGWWRELVFTDMLWWQGVLTVLLLIAIGVIVGVFLGRLILKFKGRRVSREFEKVILAQEAIEAPARVPDQPAESVEFMKEPPDTSESVPQESVNFKTPDVLMEVEKNLAIATTPWSGKPLPFETNVWDNNRDKADLLSADFEAELTEAYIDMRLANSIVWLSTEVGRRSNDLDQSYIKLCAKIAARLNRVMPSLKSSD